MSNYRKLSKHPLKMVLIEVCFTPILKMEAIVSDFHESLRQNYPFFDTRNIQSVNVSGHEVNFSSQKAWTLISTDKHSAIEVSQDRIVFVTSQYDRFEGLEKEFKRILTTLIEVAAPSMVLRIGLRYCDLIKPEEGEEIKQYVLDEFDVSSSLDDIGDKVHAKLEYVYKTSEGVLFIRSLLGLHNLTLMPDIQEVPIKIDRDQELSIRMILDFDHFWEGKDEAIEFKDDLILNKISLLHEPSRKAFWKITTEFARNEKWS